MDSVKDLLSDPLKGTKHAQGVLCYLFREVLLWRKVNWFHWNRLLTMYFEKPHNQINPDKGNLNKVLKANDMNWQAFNKAIDFLSPHKAYLDIRLHWRDGSFSEYRINIDPTDNVTYPKSNDFNWYECEIFKETKDPALLTANLFRYVVACEGAKQPDLMLWWESLFEQYTRNPANVVGLAPNEISKSIQQLRRAIMDPRLSWNGYRKGIHLLRPKAEEYTLTLQWADNEQLRKTLPDSVHPIYIADPYFVVDSDD